MFPLEVYGGGPPDRTTLELEIWQAALQEPRAEFKAFGSDWPVTTMPAFEAAWCAFQQGEELGREFDLAVRKAFFVEGKDIGRKEIVLDVAEKAGLDMEQLKRRMESGEARQAVLTEGREGKERWGMTETPTAMLPAGRKLQHALAMPEVEDGRIIAVGKLTCFGEGCDQATRKLFEEALGA
jgi:predicted DsbA family dithiol-disulfide isomerase